MSRRLVACLGLITALTMTVQAAAVAGELDPNAPRPSGCEWRNDWNPNEEWTNFPGELGDAVYRALMATDNYDGSGHAAIVKGWDTQLKTITFVQASGYMKSVEVVTWNDFKAGCLFWGARTHPTGVDLETRQRILDRALSFLGVWYGLESPWEPPMWDLYYNQYPNTPATLRCDGVVELAYEYAGKNPCYFAPAGPQNQANELAAAKWDTPQIRAIGLHSHDSETPQIFHSIDSMAAAIHCEAFDELSGIDIVSVTIEHQDDAGEWIHLKGHDPLLVIVDDKGPLVWEKYCMPSETLRNKELVPGTVYRFRFDVYDKVHHRARSRRFFAKLAAE